MILPQRGLKDLWNLKVALRNQINFKKPQSRAPVSMGAVGASTTLLITFPLINFHREKRKARIIFLVPQLSMHSLPWNLVCSMKSLTIRATLKESFWTSNKVLYLKKFVIKSGVHFFDFVCLSGRHFPELRFIQKDIMADQFIEK